MRHNPNNKGCPCNGINDLHRGFVNAGGHCSDCTCPPATNVCEHGKLKRSCIECEANECDIENEKLRAELAALLHIVDQLRAELAGSQSALERVLEYMKGRHHEGCDAWIDYANAESGRECTCGYSALARAFGAEE